MEMAKYILCILRSNLNILFSWGFNRPIAVENGLKFSVNGFKHKGIVEVRYNEGADLFDIELTNSENQLVEKIEGVYLDQLIEVIDEHVEHVDNYIDVVRQEYPYLNNL